MHALAEGDWILSSSRWRAGAPPLESVGSGLGLELEADLDRTDGQWGNSPERLVRWACIPLQSTILHQLDCIFNSSLGLPLLSFIHQLNLILAASPPAGGLPIPERDAPLALSLARPLGHTCSGQDCHRTRAQVPFHSPEQPAARVALALPGCDVRWSPGWGSGPGDRARH